MDCSKINKKTSAQVVLEFVSAFIVLLIFLVATAKIFVWFCSNIVERHKAFEHTRTLAGKESTTVGQDSFYNVKPPLDIFDESGWEPPIDVY